MIRTLLILLCLLLCGCGAQTGQSPEPSKNPPPTVAVQEGQDLGSVRIFHLLGERITDLRSLGEDLLAFSESGLTLLDRESLDRKAHLEVFLEPWDPSLVMGVEGLSFYDLQKKETVVLDRGLQEIARIPLPEGALEAPLYSGNTLYYISGGMLRAWDLDTGLRRCLREFSGEVPQLTGVHLKNRVLSCQTREGTLFLSTEDGRILQEKTVPLGFSSREDRYTCKLPREMEELLIFGRIGEQPQLLLPENRYENCFFLDETSGAVTVTSESPGLYNLDYYDLDSGRRLASLSLASDHAPLAVEDTAQGELYILMDDSGSQTQTLYCWNPRETPLRDQKQYTYPCDQEGEPNPQALEECRALADKIGGEYGIRVLLWKDAISPEPWDYHLEPEYQTAILRRELERLDGALSRYPREIIAQTADHFSSLNLCIVRSVAAESASYSQSHPTGVQFLHGTDAYVAVAAGPYLENALYHELFHVMETHILTESGAFDRWDQLNPAGFQYDYDYGTNAVRDSGIYLRRDYRAFVDTFSMSYPKEDRARIMEYAMLPGNEELFQQGTMQKKLQALCKGIRDAYGMKKDPTVYLWEQYLEK